MTTSPEERSGSQISADGLLALRYLQGDEDGFTELFRRYHPDVVRHVRAAVRDRELAEDVAQEAMARALRSLHTYDRSLPFWPWLHKITHTTLAAELAKRSAEVPVAEIAAEAVARPDDADRLVTYDAVQRALAALPARQRRALVMRYVEDRDANDLAALFGLSRNAFEQLLARGRTKFRGGYREGAVFPLGGLGARLRRLVAAIEARLQGATGATMSVAGDVAIGAALAFGGLGLAIGPRASAPPPAAWGAAPGAGAVRSGSDWAPLVALGGRAHDVTAARPGPELGAGAAPDRRWADPAGADGTGPAGPPARSPHEPVRFAAPRPTPAPGAAPSPTPTPPPPPPPPGAPGPGAAPGATPLPVAPTGGDGGADPEPSPPAASDPAPGPTAMVGGDRASVVVEEETVQSTEVTVKSDPTQEGEAAKYETKTSVGGKPVAPVVRLSNSDDDGFVCKSTGVCVM